MLVTELEGLATGLEPVQPGYLVLSCLSPRQGQAAPFRVLNRHGQVTTRFCTCLWERVLFCSVSIQGGSGYHPMEKRKDDERTKQVEVHVSVCAGKWIVLWAGDSNGEGNGSEGYIIRENGDVGADCGDGVEDGGG